jgi:3-dehydroquinate dehydratase-1
MALTVDLLPAGAIGIIFPARLLSHYHSRMLIRPQTRFGNLWLGRGPKIVGTISQAATLAQLGPFPCDIVEIRLDLTGPDQLRSLNQPTIATLRLASEGGRWNGSDADRLPLFDTALQTVTTVDIEYRSPLLKQVSALACRYGKPLIISYHDFDRTPSLAELQQVIRTAANYGTVVKIATRTETEGDVATLRALFAEQCSASVCLLGMGALGPRTRLEFPRLGSCLTYGYLDAPIAPGQVSAAELMNQLNLV